jgi:hypothetical protein
MRGHSWLRPVYAAVQPGIGAFASVAQQSHGDTNSMQERDCRIAQTFFAMTVKMLFSDPTAKSIHIGL